MTQPYECEVRFGIDDIEGLGWTAELEFEGKDPQKAGSAIRQALKALKIPLQKVTHNPISAIYLQNKAQGGTTRG